MPAPLPAFLGHGALEALYESYVKRTNALKWYRTMWKKKQELKRRPSDLDADDEDNQEYDSGAARADVLTGDSNHSTTPPLPPVGDWPINGSLHRALGEAERVQEEVRRLVQLLKEKELRIHSLERRVLSLAKELSEVTAENQELRAMNNALLDGVPLAMQPPSKE